MAGFSAGSASVDIVPDFRNAHKLIGRWVSGIRDVKIKIEPEISKLGLAREVAKIKAIRPNIHIKADTVELQHSVAKAVDSLVGLTDTASKVSAIFGKPTLMAGAIGGLVELAAAAGQASGALLLLPAGIAAIAAPAAAVTIGLQGMGDAFKALGSGDIEKINAAMRNLAPAARSFVKEINALGPAWKAARLDIQQQLFSEMGDSVVHLARVGLPVLRSGLGDVAGSFGQLAAKITDTLATQKSLDDFGQIFANVGSSTRLASNGMAALTRIFRDLTTVGSEFLPDLAKGFSDAATATANWVAKARESGKLTEIIQLGLDRLRQLANLLVNVGQLAFEILRAAAGPGARLMQILTEVIGQFAYFLKVGEGHSALADFFKSIAGFANSVKEGFLDLAKSLVTNVLPVFSRIFNAFGPVINTILQEFAKLFEEVGPIFGSFAEAAARLFSAVAPLVHVFGELVKIALPPFIHIMNALAPLISDLSSRLGDFVVEVAHQLQPVLNLAARAFIEVVKAIFPLLDPVADLVRALLPPLISLMKAIIPVVVEIVKALAPAIAALVRGLTPALRILADVISWTFQHIAGPIIVWVVEHIIVPLIKKAGDFFHNLAATIKFVWEKIIQPVIRFFGDQFSKLWNQFLKPIWREMQLAWRLLALYFKSVNDGIIQPIWRAIQRAADWLWRTILSPIWKAMQRGWDALMRAMRWTYDHILHPMWHVFEVAINGVKRTFEIIVGGIRTAWDKIKAIAAAPINFVIRYVFNNGLFAAWNWINEKLHLGFPKAHFNEIRFAQGGRVPAFAEGGIIPGPYLGPTADNMLGLVNGHPIRVNPREYIQPVSAVDYYGEEGMEAIRARRIPKALLQGWAGGGLIPAFAGGGFTWPQMDALRKQWYPGSVLTSAYRPGSPDYHGLGEAIDIGWPGNDRAQLYRIAADLVRRAPGSSEIIHNPNASVKNGRPVPPSFWGPAVWADHADHVHWAMANMAQLLAGASASGSAGIDFPWWQDLWHNLSGAYNWIHDHLKAVGQIAGKFGHSELLTIAEKVPSKVFEMVWKSVKGAISSLFTYGRDVAPGDLAGVKKVVNDLASLPNWNWGSGVNWQALNLLIQGESSWNPKAQNPTSSASGLFQQIDSTWRTYRPPSSASVAHMKDAIVYDQAQAGFAYIKAAYGSPNNAYNTWLSRSPHWYDQGGLLPPGLHTVYNGTGAFETVRNNTQELALRSRLGGTVGGVPIVNVYIGMDNLARLVDARIEVKRQRDYLDARSS